jgi:integration host factor subunit beta
LTARKAFRAWLEKKRPRGYNEKKDKGVGHMNKSQLVEKLAEEALLSSKQAEQVVNIFFDSITEGLIREGRAELRGLGSFKIKEYACYVGRNPKSGEPIEVPPKKLPFFKVGRELKAMVDLDH